MRRACKFKQSDLTRAMRAAASAGVRVRIEIEPSGKIVMVPMDNGKLQDEQDNPWDSIYAKDSKRPS